MRAGHRHEHNGHDGNHHEPYRYERDYGHYVNNHYRDCGYDEHNGCANRDDHGNGGYYYRHLHRTPLEKSALGLWVQAYITSEQ
jgi:hypothetical protein